jgi:hypothetical protein
MSDITELIKQLKANTALNAFFTTHYQKSLSHSLGYKKNPTKNDLPVICYVPSNAHIANKSESVRTVSLVLIVEDDRILDIDGVELTPAQLNTTDIQLFSGAMLSEQAQFLIIEALTAAIIGGGSVIIPAYSIKTDMTLGYPYFQTEIAFEIKMNYEQDYDG